MSSKQIIGTISHGTLHPYDLANAFLEVIGELAPAVYQQLVFPCGMTPDYLCAIDEGRRAEYWDSEDAVWFVSELENTLVEYAPEGFYFGAHDGDGACFGFWETEEHAAERAWGEFTAEFEDSQSGPLAARGAYLRSSRKVLLCGEDQADTFQVFAFGAYGDTYVAVGRQSGPCYRASLDGDLESAAECLYGEQPGMFIEPDYAQARDELHADGTLTDAEYADLDSDEVADKVAQHAETDLTYTESGWLASYEWSIVGAFDRAELLAFVRGE